MTDFILHMSKKRGHKKQGSGSSNTVDTQRIWVQQMGRVDRYGMNKLGVNSDINYRISGPIHITRIQFCLMVGIVGITVFVAPGMGGGLGSTTGAGDYAGHPVIKSMTYTDHDIDRSTTDYGTPDVSGNYNLAEVLRHRLNNL